MRKSSPRGPYKMRYSAEELFWGKVDKSGACWLWTGSRKGGSGSYKYGSFITGGRINKTQWYAHRYSYFLAKGSLPEGLDIMHSCDNGLCVNPDHLSPGTRLQNMQDAVLRNRLKPYDRRGEKNSNCRLTLTQVIEIKKLLSEGITGRAVGILFNTPECTISDIKRGKSWKDA